MKKIFLDTHQVFAEDMRRVQAEVLMPHLRILWARQIMNVWF